MKKLLTSIILILNLIVAILFVVSTLAGFVRPSVCVWVSLLSYGYVPLFIINVCFVLFWLFFSSKYFLISLLTIAIRYSFLPLYYQTSGNDVDTDEGNISVMSFNVHKFTEEDNATLTTLAVVRADKPDVICFQEFDSKPGRVNIYDSIRREGYAYNHSHVRKNRLPRGTSIFSKYPIIESGKVDSTRNIYVDIKMPGDTIRIYNVHFSSYRLDEEDRDEIDRIKHGDVTETSIKTLDKFKTTAIKHEKELDELIMHIEGSPYRSVLCGDLNDTPASYAYQRLKEIYADAYVEQGSGLSVTYDGMFPAFRIDYVLLDKAFTVDSYKRLKTDISDHYPLIVSFKTVGQ